MLMRFLFHGIAGLHVHGIRQWSLAEDLKKRYVPPISECGINRKEFRQRKKIVSRCTMRNRKKFTIDV
jgi:hypothetical protein